MARSHIRFLLLALLAAVAYARALGLPLIEDDYPNLVIGQQYGSLAALPALFQSHIFLPRATSVWSMFLLWNTFHLTPLAYHLASLLLHIANVWLLYGVALAWPRLRPAAFWAAAFFAVQEGHQEAVMWFSAINELWMFFFGCAALLCWLAAGRKGAWLNALGALLFALALLSKESAVIFLPLFLLAAPPAGWKRVMARWLPYAALGAVSVAFIATTRDYSFRFSDGSFSLAAPFWITWPRGIARVLWIWGWPAAAMVWFSRDRKVIIAAGLALAWIGIGLLPYSFLTYSTEIPSRQTYLASAGLALLVGLALTRLQDRRAVLTAATAVLLLHNAGYLWTRKHAQFIQRAEPTEQLIALARRTQGTIWVRSFPRPALIAQDAVRLGAGHDPGTLIWTEEEARRTPPAAVFSYEKRY